MNHIHIWRNGFSNVETRSNAKLFRYIQTGSQIMLKKSTRFRTVVELPSRILWRIPVFAGRNFNRTITIHGKILFCVNVIVIYVNRMIFSGFNWRKCRDSLRLSFLFSFCFLIEKNFWFVSSHLLQKIDHEK